MVMDVSVKTVVLWHNFEIEMADDFGKAMLSTSGHSLNPSPSILSVTSRTTFRFHRSLGSPVTGALASDAPTNSISNHLNSRGTYRDTH